MRTTSKVFKTVVRLHITGILTNDFTTDTKGKLQALMDDFHAWYQPKLIPNKQVAFREFLQGIPTGINIEYTYDGFQKVIREWFEESNTEYVERSMELEENFYYHIITREIREMCRMEKIQF